MAFLPARLIKSRRARFVALVAILVLAALWFSMPYLRGDLVRIDSDKPWLIEFGRGSGWHGLDTVKLLEDGSVVLHRMTDRNGRGWEVVQLKLDAQDLARVLEAVESNRLLGLQKAYHSGVCDGTQWVLRIKQGDWEKAFYFDNSFPAEIVSFAAVLDEVLAKNGVEQAAWRRVAYADERQHERDLWESIRR